MSNLRTVAVMSPIEFDNELFGVASKIGKVRSYRCLTTKVPTLRREFA